MKDEENPQFLFSGINTSLLINIVNGNIDPKYLAVKELANRGYDLNGKWVGFEVANKILTTLFPSIS